MPYLLPNPSLTRLQCRRRQLPPTRYSVRVRKLSEPHLGYDTFRLLVLH